MEQALLSRRFRGPQRLGHAQAIGAFDVALHDLKARRAGLPLTKLLGSYRDSVACYSTSGGFLHTPLDQLPVNAAASRERAHASRAGPELE